MNTALLLCCLKDLESAGSSRVQNHNLLHDIPMLPTQTAGAKRCTLWLKTTTTLHTIPNSLTGVKVVSKKSFSRKLYVQIRVNFFELEKKKQKQILLVISPLGHTVN